jgi:DNA-3-methyladenine glycosylase
LSELFQSFDGPAERVARRLLGQRLVRRRGGRTLAGIIVEVEAYLGARDKAAHSYGGRRTARNASMYLPAGHAYVYMIYGLHHCLNIVCGRGCAILVRALEPVDGIEAMRTRRPTSRATRDLCAGPGRLAQALAIDRSLDGAPLDGTADLYVERVRDTRSVGHIVAAPRIGVGYAEEWAARPLRFYLEGNPSVSGPRARPPISV